MGDCIPDFKVKLPNLIQPADKSPSARDACEELSSVMSCSFFDRQARQERGDLKKSFLADLAHFAVQLHFDMQYLNAQLRRSDTRILCPRNPTRDVDEHRFAVFAQTGLQSGFQFA